MSILKNLLKSKSNLLTINKEEIDILTYVMCNRIDFEAWFAQQNTTFPKIRFVFYYPTAIDFYYDAFKLFTVYFKREQNDQVVFHQFKITQLNMDSLKSFNWTPFKDAIVSYLVMAQERNSDLQFKKLHALHEYQALCNGEATPKSSNNSFFLNLSAASILPESSI